MLTFVSQLRSHLSFSPFLEAASGTQLQALHLWVEEGNVRSWNGLEPSVAHPESGKESPPELRALQDP